MGVLHSRWRVLNETSDCRAFGFVAGASPTGMLTRPKLMDPFQIVRIAAKASLPGPPKFHVRRAFPFRRAETVRVPDKLPPVTEVASAPQRAAEPAHGHRTIGRLWRDAHAAGQPTAPYAVETDSGWRDVSWEEAARRVDDLANGLLAAGVGHGDVVAIIGRTRLEWTLLDFALAMVGAVSAAIYPTSSGQECRYLLNHAEAVAAFVEDEELRERVRGCGSLPRLRHLATFDEILELEERGREHRAAHPDALSSAEAAVREDDPFTYIYTSGTTGPPKACVIRHRNYYDMAATVDRLEQYVTSDDVMLLWLPLAHNFGRLMSLLGPHVGFTVALWPDPYTVGDALPHVRPT